MSKFVSLSFGLLFFSLMTWSQTTSPTAKECRISTGIGFASATKNMKKAGPYSWLQLDYTLKEEISIAFEFENFAYKQPGYFTNLPVKYRNKLLLLTIPFHYLLSTMLKQ